MAGDGFLIISLQSGSGEVLNMRRFISKVTRFTGMLERDLVLIFPCITITGIISPWLIGHLMRSIMGEAYAIKG